MATAKPPRRRRAVVQKTADRQVARQITQDDFVARIDDLLATVAASYIDFVEQGAPREAKEFAIFHGAARAAAVHIRTLHEFLRSLEQDDTPVDVAQEGSEP